MSFAHVHLVLESALKPHLKLTALVYAEMADVDSGECYPAYATVARRSSTSRRRAIENTKTLIEMGVLTKVGSRPAQNGAVNIYRMDASKLTSDARDTSAASVTSDANDTGGVSPTSPGGCRPHHLTSDAHDTQNHHRTINEPSKNHHKGRRAKKSSERFAEFWALYPKKAAKPEALAAWEKGGKNRQHDFDAIADTLLADIRKRIQFDDQWQRGFIPNPTTYLNQDRWLDDIAAPVGKQSSADQAVSAVQQFLSGELN